MAFEKKVGYHHFYPETKEDPTWLSKLDLHLISELDEFKKILEDHKDSKYISWDTETTGLNYDIDRIVGFSFSYDGVHGWYVPIRHLIGKNLPPEETLQLFYEGLKNKMSFEYNMRFDTRMMEKEGFDMSIIRYYDVQVGVFASDTNWLKTGLKGAERRFLGWTAETFEEALGDVQNFSYLDPADGGYVYACVTGDTEVLMANSSYKRVYDIKVGDYIKTASGFHSVVGFYNQGVHRISQLKYLGDGNENILKCTSNHKVAVQSVIGNVWCYVKDLDNRMDLALNVSQVSYEESIFDNYERVRAIFDKDFMGYLSGVVSAYGLSYEGKIFLNLKTNKDLINKIKVKLNLMADEEKDNIIEIREPLIVEAINIITMYFVDLDESYMRSYLRGFIEATGKIVRGKLELKKDVVKLPSINLIFECINRYGLVVQDGEHIKIDNAENVLNSVYDGCDFYRSTVLARFNKMNKKNIEIVPIKHNIISYESTEELQYVYDIQVTGEHLYQCRGGLISKNCVDAVGTFQVAQKTLQFYKEGRAATKTLNEIMYPFMKSEDAQIRIDLEYLRECETEIIEKLKNLEHEIIRIVGYPFKLNSNKQLGDALQSIGISTNQYTKTGQMKVDIKALEDTNLQEPNKILTLLIDYSKTFKLYNTYISVLIREAEARGGKLRFNFKICSVPTARLASGKDAKNPYFAPINVMAIPKPHPKMWYVHNYKGEKLKPGEDRILNWRFSMTDKSPYWTESTDPHMNMRASFLPDEGHYVVGMDYCLDPESLIETAEGLVTMKNLKDGDLVKTSSGYKRCIKPHFTKIRQVWELITKSGKKLRCSADHRIKVKRGRNIVYVRCEDLKPFDKVIEVD